MPFILGYFGKNSSVYAEKIKTIAQSQSDEISQAINQHNQYILYAGTSTYKAHKQDSVIPLANNQGVLVGKVFTKETYERVLSFDIQESDHLVNSPRVLSKSYWGRYAGILYDERMQKITLMRDPIGLSTIFHMRVGDGLLFSSDIHLMYDCLDVKPVINWNYFADYIIGQQYAPSLTPFEGILELQPGMMLRYTSGGDSEQELFWDTSAIVSKPIIDELAFEEKLLHTLKECTRAWIKDSGNVCVELSGGTDSTAVAILLREVLGDDQKLICVNYIDSNQPSSNEIEYAKEVAQLCDASLFYVDMHHFSLMDKPKFDFRPNRPTTFSLFRGMDVQIGNIALAEHCTEILNGQGGDHVFLAPPPELALADYWSEKGLQGSKRILQELSTYYRMSSSSLLWRNMKALMSYYQGKNAEEVSYSDSIPKLIADKQTEHGHYLHKVLKNYPQAKKTHFQSIAHAVAFAERKQRMPHWISTHPLLSQPVVELGLQIPTYQSFGQGYDRIFFRRAVSKLKKPKALWRHIKGQTTSSMLSSLAKNADALQNMLLEGSLMKAGLIDEKWLFDNFTSIKHGKIDNMWPIVTLITAQQWLHEWNL